MFEDFLLELGFSKEEILLFKHNKLFSRYSEKEFCDKVRNIYDYLLSLGYSKDEVLKITSYNLLISNISVMHIKYKYNFLVSLGYTNDEVKKIILSNNRILLVTENEIRNSIRVLNKLNYTNDDIKLMVLRYPHILNSSEDIEKRYEEILSLGYESDNVKEITKKNPELYGDRYYVFSDKINCLKEFKFDDSIILKLTKDFDYFYYILIDDIKNKIKDLRLIGFSLEDIHNMVDMYPKIFLLSSNDIIDKMQNLISLGYSYASSLELLRANALIFSQSTGYIKSKLNLFFEFGYSFLDIKNMTLECPNIYNISLEELLLKLEFIRITRLRNAIIDNPNYLMSDIASMYSRYMYLNSKGNRISSSNYEMLFISNDDFNNKYGVNQEEINNNYDKNKLISSYVRGKRKK